MHALVTGAAGFIGSNLTRELLSAGASVRAVDAYTPYYEERDKRANLSDLLHHPQLEMVEADLGSAALAPLLDGVEVVFHQAGQPGVRSSWATGFGQHVEQNIVVTQRLLEASKAASLRRFVYASSSSVYGNAASYPTFETDLPAPTSPYGVTKLAAEHLTRLYARNWDVPTVALRYFTVYGPGQRPDMATHRLIEAGLSGRSFPLYGDGSHIRDFTYVGDVVRANLLAAEAEVAPGSVLNIAGGSSIAMRGLMALVEEVLGRPLQIDAQPEQPGDVHRTGGDISAARAALGWSPVVPLEDGIKAQVAWHEQRRRV